MAKDDKLAEYIRIRIRYAREEAGISQEDLARVIGKTNATISDIERGKVGVSAIDLAKIAKALKRTLNYFFPFSAIVRVPKDELSTTETHLISDYREIDSLELQGFLERTARFYAAFSKKGRLQTVIDDFGTLAKIVTDSDVDLDFEE